jgi:hypothetical protein
MTSGESDQFSRYLARSIGVTRLPPEINPHVAAVNPTKLLKASQKGRCARL